MNLTGKIILITGSSDGIGKESAIAFARHGAKVIITYNSNKKGGEEVFEKCRKISDAALFHLDVRDNQSIENCIKSAIKKFGKIDILVNNAGVVSRKFFLEQNYGEIDSQIDINLKGLIKMTLAYLHHSEKNSEKMIINIASGAGKNAFSGLTTYCSSKWGVRGFTQSLAKEMPEIKIYSINAGRIATKISNYTGTPTEAFAEVIVKTAREEMDVESGGDIDVFWNRS